MASESKRGRIVVISGPSGAGKGTVVARLLEDSPVELVESVSVTTREPRSGEVDGKDYQFIAAAEFEQFRQDGRFLESFQVFGTDCWYGTLIDQVEPRLEAGQWVILEIDVKGARQVVEHDPLAVTIFLDPGSLDELERRLRGRQTENEDAIRVRLAQASCEMAAVDWYKYRVVNDQVERAADEIREILRAESQLD
jgi:guanylate kinase